MRLVPSEGGSHFHISRGNRSDSISGIMTRQKERKRGFISALIFWLFMQKPNAVIALIYDVFRLDVNIALLPRWLAHPFGSHSMRVRILIMPAKLAQFITHGFLQRCALPQHVLLLLEDIQHRRRLRIHNSSHLSSRAARHKNEEIFTK